MVSGDDDAAEGNRSRGSWIELIFQIEFQLGYQNDKICQFLKIQKVSNNYKKKTIYLQVLKDPSATMVVLVASLQDHLSCCIDSTNLTPQEANENLLNFISDITDTLEHTPGQNITTALVG